MSIRIHRMRNNYNLPHSPQYISINDKGSIGKILSHWPKKEEARISVVTDGKAFGISGVNEDRLMIFLRSG